MESSPPRSAGTRLALLHLVWAPLGPGPLREFLSSYHEHEAGAEHELVVALNGRRAPGVGAQEIAVLERELRGTTHRLLEIEQPLQDLAAYARALAALDHERVCVLNSYSRVRADGWLAMLDAALSQPGVGLAGASGSWASQGSYARFQLGLPSPYRRVYGDRAQTVRQFQELEGARSGRRSLGLRGAFDTGRKLLGDAVRFPPFPAPHVRTNAFMGRRELLSGLLSSPVRSKVDAYRLESGPASMTCRVREMGLDAVVVDREGRAFLPQEWARSGTFWQGEQGPLLIADNQSELYQRADPRTRLLLSRLAWGEQAAVEGARSPA
jgi:hypothetical protein